MALPIKTSVEDIEKVCNYLATKPTGATLKEAKAVVDSKHLDPRKLSALKAWNLIEEVSGKFKVTPAGRSFARGTREERQRILRQVISGCPPYNAILERATHRPTEDSVNAVDVAAHWHQHFPEEVGQSDVTLNDQAICFLNLADGAGLGALVVGRRGNPTRFDWDRNELRDYAGGEDRPSENASGETTIRCNEESNGSSLSTHSLTKPGTTDEDATGTKRSPSLGQAIFLAHGKNKAPLEQLKKILGQFNIPFKVAIDEPNLGRPISSKVRETMQQCNCAILLFTADEKLIDKNNDEIWRPSENVVYELGACSYLYGDRVVIIKEDKVLFPSNFRDIGYISFSDGGMDAKAMEILKELIGFGIVKVST